jgi:small-conductance mechanosensitive channel
MKDNVTRDNRKALPKFLLMILAAAAVGGVVGFFSSTAVGSMSTEALSARIDAFLGSLVPWGLPVCVALLLIPAAVLLGKARRAFAAWDGEDEAVAWAVEDRLNAVMLLGTLATIMGFFFLSVGMIYTWESLRLLVNTAFFVVDMAVTMILQQRVVDLTRRMNPEKEGSVYDRKFKKKWLESCDEAERAQIGQASYQAFQTTSGICMVLWLVLLLGGLFYPTGILPTVAVLLIYGVLQGRYMIECIRMHRRSR